MECAYYFDFCRLCPSLSIARDRLEFGEVEIHKILLPETS